MTRIVNNLIEAIRERKRLPKYLVVIPDKDLLLDINTSDEDVAEILQDHVRWVVRQIDTTINRNVSNFLEKKPGALTGYIPTTIYVKMLRRVGSFSPESKIYGMLKLRVKLNDCLNDETAKVEQKILTINSCNSYDHFDRHGNLSSKGKHYFWMELDDLLERLDKNKIKLLPNPKNPPGTSTRRKPNNQDRDGRNQRRLPTPPPKAGHSKYYY